MSLCPLDHQPCTSRGAVNPDECFRACASQAAARLGRASEAVLSSVRYPGELGSLDDLASELTRWWLEDSATLADATVAKMAEYGSGDLVQLGQHLRRMAGRPVYTDLDQAMQLGCLMYLIGKLERAVEAVSDDRDVKDDTWLDIEVYAKMARANRAGVWTVPAALKGEPE